MARSTGGIRLRLPRICSFTFSTTYITDMCKFWRYALMVFVAYPVIHFWLGLNVRHRDRLVTRGPAIIAANHNSHINTLALLTLFPLSMIPKVRPVAAADYFMRSDFLAWFARTVVGIIPVERAGNRDTDPLAECHAALDRGEILIIFPEGTRGEPERMRELKCGVAYLAKSHAQVPVVPVFMHGLGKSLPKGARVPVPFFVNVSLGEPFRWTGSRESFMAKLHEMFDRLHAEIPAPEYL